VRGIRIDTDFIAYFVGAYVADVVLKSGRKSMSPEEIAMIVDRALENLSRPEGASGEALLWTAYN